MTYLGVGLERIYLILLVARVSWVDGVGVIVVALDARGPWRKGTDRSRTVSLHVGQVVIGRGGVTATSILWFCTDPLRW